MLRMIGLEYWILMMLPAFGVVFGLATIVLGVVAMIKPSPMLGVSAPLQTIGKGLSDIIMFAVLLFLLVSSHPWLDALLPADWRLSNHDSDLSQFLNWFPIEITLIAVCICTGLLITASVYIEKFHIPYFIMWLLNLALRISFILNIAAHGLIADKAAFMVLSAFLLVFFNTGINKP